MSDMQNEHIKNHTQRVYADDIGSEEMKRLHECMLEILDDFVRICEKNNLKYYLTGGTLLGAIRHKGFIPWDDDLDVVMSRSDYNKFIEIVEKEESLKFTFQSHENDKKYWAIFGKYRKNGTEINENATKHLNVNKAIFIDVFPLDDYDEKKEKAFLRRRKYIKMLDKCMQIKAKIGSTYNRFDKKIIRVLLLPFSNSMLYKKQYRLMTAQNNKDYSTYINYGTNYSFEKSIFPKSYYGDGLMVPFEDRMYRIPIEWEKILTTVFGDYMKLPPKDKQILTHKPIYIDFGNDE